MERLSERPDFPFREPLLAHRCATPLPPDASDPARWACPVCEAIWYWNNHAGQWEEEI